MLAFYGWKGSPKAGLVQDVAIEAGHTVREIPTWMGLAAKWRMRCVSLTKAKDILAGCKRLEQARAPILSGTIRPHAPTLWTLS